MFPVNKFTDSDSARLSETWETMRELKRLQLLDNGVRNYSGGIYTLHKRIERLIHCGEFDYSEIRTLLKDLSVYLRDLKIVGRIEDDSAPSLQQDY